MSDSFISLGEALDKVVDLADRRRQKVEPLLGIGGVNHRNLEASVAKLKEDEKHKQEMREWYVKRGKEQFTRSLNEIRDNSSPEYAIKFLEDTLAAVKG